MLTTSSRSGLRVTAPMCDQSRVLPDQRAELCCLAWVRARNRASSERVDATAVVKWQVVFRVREPYETIFKTGLSALSLGGCWVTSSPIKDSISSSGM